MTRVLIVDDHSIFRTGLRTDLGDAVEVLGEAGDVDAAVAAIAELRPEVVLLDVHLPGGAGGGGAEVVRRSAALLGEVRFL
ncbi:response regulator transcription factor, partial [Schumannella luteola]